MGIGHGTEIGSARRMAAVHNRFELERVFPEDNISHDSMFAQNGERNNAKVTAPMLLFYTSSSLSCTDGNET